MPSVLIPKKLPKCDGAKVRIVPGFPRYAVSSTGIVWSAFRHRGWRRLKPRPNKDGHLVVMPVGQDGKPHHRFVHQLVLETFVGPCPPGMEACHFPDHSPANNNLQNLKWGTRKENAAHCILHDRRPRGDRHGRAKLRVSDVHAITRLVSLGRLPKAHIARRFGVAASTVANIAARKIWKHVPVR